MEKFNSQRIFTSVIIAAFCCSFIFIIPATVKYTNQPSISIKDPIISTLSGSNNPTSDEWPMFHHSLNHTGVTETSPVGNIGPIWNYTTNDSIYYSSPAVAKGMVYIGSDDGNLYCLNASTGTEIWYYFTLNWVFSSPAVVNGMVYVGDDDDNLYCINAVTGVKNWSFTTGGSISSSPAVVNGMVYVGSDDGNLYCINAVTGAKNWKYTTNGAVASSPAFANGMIYVGSDDDNLYCINAVTGAKNWSFTTGYSVFSSPAVAKGMVYVEGGDNNVYCLDASTGAKIWNSTIVWGGNSSPAVANGMVYVGSDDNNVYCLNASTGAKIWKYNTNNYVDSSPAVANGMIFVGSDYGNIYCLNASTGAKIWKYTTGGAVESSPAVANGMVYEGSGNKIYCLPMIFYTIPSSPLSFTAIGGSGQVNLSWNAPLDDGFLPITGYNVYRGNSSGSETFLTNVSTATTQYIDKGLIGGEKYFYIVSANNSLGEGSLSNEVNAVPPTGFPTAPRSFSISKLGVYNLTFTWKAPLYNGGLEILGYNIYRGNSSGTETLITTVSGNTLNYTDTGLASNTTYYYKINAINSFGEGKNSSEFVAQTWDKSILQVTYHIGGMNIESLLLVSLIGVIVVVVGVKKRMK